MPVDPASPKRRIAPARAFDYGGQRMLCLLLALLSLSLAADPRDEVAQAFQDAPQRADFLFLLDLGGEARAPAAVGEALAVLAERLPEGDQLAVIGFSADPVTLLPPVLLDGDTRAQAAATLRRMKLPRGPKSDLGLALQTAAELLGADPEASLRFVFMLSDFCHDPPADSPFSFGGGDQCRQIRGLKGLSEATRRAVGGAKIFPVALTLQRPDRDGLRSFFNVYGVDNPRRRDRLDATTLDLNQWAEGFTDGLSWLKLTALVDQEVRQIALRATLASVEETRARFTLQSGMKHLTLHLDNVSTDQVNVAVRTSSVDLSPEGSVELELLLPDPPFSWRPVQRTVTVVGTMTATATLEPRVGLGRLEIAPGRGILTAPFLFTVTQTYGLPAGSLPAAIGAGVLAVLGLGVLIALRRRR